jgi:hypothetical protein
MHSVTTLDVALVDAPRRILDRVSTEQASIQECLDVMKDPKRKYDCKDASSPVEFSADSAALFNTHPRGGLGVEWRAVVSPGSRTPET